MRRTMISTLFHNVDNRVITGECPSFDGVVITGKMLELQPVYVAVLLVVFGTNACILILGCWRLIFGIWIWDWKFDIFDLDSGI